jgi:hypothetical protein
LAERPDRYAHLSKSAHETQTVFSNVPDRLEMREILSLLQLTIEKKMIDEKFWVEEWKVEKFKEEGFEIETSSMDLSRTGGTQRRSAYSLLMETNIGLAKDFEPVLHLGCEQHSSDEQGGSKWIGSKDAMPIVTN